MDNLILYGLVAYLGLFLLLRYIVSENSDQNPDIPICNGNNIDGTSEGNFISSCQNNGDRIIKNNDGTISCVGDCQIATFNIKTKQITYSNN